MFVETFAMDILSCSLLMENVGKLGIFEKEHPVMSMLS